MPMRQELIRTKEIANKERMGRLSAQQEVSMLKEQLHRLESMNESLDREVKTIPGLSESNEILKNDLQTLRKRSKEEKAAFQKYIKKLESKSSELETFKGIIRDLSLKLLDVTNGGTGAAAAAKQPYTHTGSSVTYQQQMRYSNSTSSLPQKSSIQTSYQHQQQPSGKQSGQYRYQEEEDADDDEDDDDDDDYESGGHLDDEDDEADDVLGVVQSGAAAAAWCTGMTLHTYRNEATIAR